MCRNSEHGIEARNNRRQFLQIAAAGAAAGSLARTSQAQERRATAQAGKASQQEVSAILQDWPSKSKEVAQEMIQKYGQPDEAASSRLIWHQNGPWKYTIVYRETVPHNFPKEHVDMLEQTINYDVPPEKFDELAWYDGSVTVQRTRGEMSAMCDKEAMNFLALNLAHGIITGGKSVEEARREYAKTAMAFMQGQKLASTQELQFRTAAARGTGDPDIAIIEDGQIKEEVLPKEALRERDR